MSNSSESPTPQLTDLLLCLRALDAGMWHYDIDADQLWCDSRWYALLGLVPGRVKCMDDFRRFIHPDDVDTATRINLAEVARMIERDRRYHVDFRVIRTDGAVRCWRSVACLIIDTANGHRRAVGCITDITDARKLAVAPAHIADGTSESDDDQPGNEHEVDARPGEPLSERERECLRWVSLGKTAWETSVIMSRSPRTVEFHLLNAVRKLGAINKVHAAVIAVRQGLI